MSKLVNYLTCVDSNVSMAEAFLNNPEKAMLAFGLSSDEISEVISGNVLNEQMPTINTHFATEIKSISATYSGVGA